MTNLIVLPAWITSAQDEQGKNITLCIRPKICIEKSTLVEFVQIVNDVLPGITSWIKFTLQDLSGDEFWLSKSIYQRIMLGKTMTYLVNNGYTPFTYADYSCRSPKRYMLEES
jgi:hypothetical protein